MVPADPIPVLEDLQPEAGSSSSAKKGPNRHSFFLSAPRNLEGLLTDELREMGIEDASPRPLGVEVKLSRDEVYKVVYGSRLASRVLRPLASFPCRNADELYEQAVKLKWNKILKPDQTLKVSASVSDSSITHSQYAALKLKDAVVDVLREHTGARPSIDRETPDVRLDLYLRSDQATISLYYSDGIMHRRGYRIQAVDAPLKENLAAAIIRFSGWNGGTPFLDLFCGSGTFLIEAAMVATHTPAGFFRPTQGFETLPDFSPTAWAKVKGEMDREMTPLGKGLITGIDISARAMAAVRANLAKTPYADAVKLLQKDFARVDGPLSGRVVVANPPYGVRLEDTQEGLKEMYKNIGQFLKTKCPGSKAYVMIPGSALEKEIWFKPDRRLLLDNGALEVTVAEYAVLPEREPRPPKAGAEPKADAKTAKLEDAPAPKAERPPVRKIKPSK
jgi:putative N6-adenine-specific DNA methylase